MDRADPPATIAVLGAGSWGTALALALARNGHRVRLWGHLPEHVAALIRDRENREFLPGFPLPDAIEPTADLKAAVGGADELLVVVPSHAFRAVLTAAREHLDPATGVSWATKGFESGSRKLLSEVAREVLGERSVAVVSGPTFANEVAADLPTAVTIAGSDPAHAERVAGYLRGENLRPYTASDLIGVQLGGACKNVMAIAAGIADGLGFGANSRAALITRGLAEIMRLGTALGGQVETFMGLAGLGDLALTCTDDQSRNRRLGLALARGLTVEQACAEIGQAIEGIRTAREVHQLARETGVDMPITTETYRVLFEGLAPEQAVRNLLGRRPKSEGV